MWQPRGVRGSQRARPRLCAEPARVVRPEMQACAPIGARIAFWSRQPAVKLAARKFAPALLWENRLAAVRTSKSERIYTIAHLAVSPNPRWKMIVSARVSCTWGAAACCDCLCGVSGRLFVIQRQHIKCVKLFHLTDVRDNATSILCYSSLACNRRRVIDFGERMVAMQSSLFFVCF